MRVSIGIALATLALLGACNGSNEEANNSAVANNAALAVENQNVTDASADSLVAIDDDGMGNGEVPAEEVGNTGELPVTDANAQ
jgi:hypothetical protein